MRDGAYLKSGILPVSAKGGLMFHVNKTGSIEVLGSIEEIFPYISKNYCIIA